MDTSGIEQSLGVAAEVLPSEKPKPKKKEHDINIEKDVKNDYEYSRGQLYDVIEKVRQVPIKKLFSN